MKRIMIGILAIGISQIVNAETFHSSIHSIAFGKGTAPHLVRFDNGRVSFLESEKGDLLQSLQFSLSKGRMVKVKADSSNTIRTVKAISYAAPVADDLAWATKREPYTPAVVKNSATAQKIFGKMRKDYTKSGECFNRAHIWGLEEYKRSGLKSMKVFMFFTERYIRKYNFHWWFHVTPMVYVKNLTSPRTLDRRYTSGPRQMKTWSDTFVRSKRSCKIVKKFDDYWLNQKSQDCYHIYTSMHYYVPRDIEKRDLTGVEKTEFVDREIKKAYKNGFKKR
ncbi:protein-glutamine glutaminase family protein [Peredibacter starrii]|uniref:Protein-glutamine glutaminase family protein n=1 Tax=Peredibacter starrii TaxID=28202 RepID=A0AAX4HJ86_9BACT|nr:protein-glutamine glutaminase family protein [Peredibacter starrii]WPU63282.1 protein-glutamine glutaminase family protein [Peredibacter starrii]